jgi:cephalosporin-C deacetylase-like acetyl esterase
MNNKFNFRNRNLKRIFAEAAQDKELKYFDERKLAQLAQTTRHLIFMVDEVIGDSAGIALLHELVKIATAKPMKLNQHFKVKIIASDASIAGTDVIKQHLSKREPSPAKNCANCVSWAWRRDG